MHTNIKDSIFLTGITEFEVLKTVKNFKKKKSNDPHGLSMEILMQVIPNIVKPLTYICNKSFLEGCFPDRMKISRIVPIFKAGDNSSLNNYRPISILSQFSKLLEKLFQNILLSFVEKNNVLNDNQYGFRQNRSTTIALFDLSQKVSTFLDNKLSALGIFVDLRKAFDTIDHGILLKKVEYMGVRGIALKWVASYINNRKQYVSFLNENSSYADVVCGVPQGSILGPLLFILYIDDICNISNYLGFTLFADDTTIVFQIGAGLYAVGRPVQKRNDEDGQIGTIQSLPLERGALFNRFFGEPAHGPPHVAGGASGPIGGCQDESRTDSPDLDLRHVFDRNNRKTDLI